MLNVALHGLEEAAGVRYHGPARAGWVRDDSPVAVRYADDFAVCCHTRQQAESIRERLAGWLAGRGLALNEDKTRIVHLTQGFDFLGWNFRRYPGFKLLIKPSKAAIRKHRQRLADETRRLRGANAGMVIAALNPVIRGWTAYHRGMVSSKIFESLGTTRGSSPTSGHGGRTRAKPSPLGRQQVLRQVLPVQERQVGLRRPGETGAYLLNHAWTGIRRHVMVKGRHLPMTRTWPDTGKTGGARTDPRSTAAPWACSPGRTAGARAAGDPLLTDDQPPAPTRNGNSGGSASPASASRRAATTTGTRPPEGSRTLA